MIETRNAGPRTIDLNESEIKSAGTRKSDQTRKFAVQGEVAKFAPESLKAEQHRKQAEPKAVNE